MNTTVQIKDVSTTIRTFAKKKSVQAATGGLIFCAAAMIFSNPGQPAYVDYATERLFREIKQTCGELKGDFDWVTFAMDHYSHCQIAIFVILL